MADFAELAAGFEYDLWANQLWLKFLNRKGTGDPDRAILAHVLSAQKIWLMRCHGTSLNQMPDVPLSESMLAEVSSGWTTLLKAMAHNPVISYQRTTGQALNSPLSEIAIHVVNHGTYHRGELRGLCRLRNDEDFPETDRMRYFLTVLRQVEL